MLLYIKENCSKNHLKYIHSFVYKMPSLWMGEEWWKCEAFHNFCADKVKLQLQAAKTLWQGGNINALFMECQIFLVFMKIFSIFIAGQQQVSGTGSRKLKQQECNIKSQVAGLLRINYTELICIQLEAKGNPWYVYVAQSALFNDWQVIYDSDLKWITCSFSCCCRLKFEAEADAEIEMHSRFTGHCLIGIDWFACGLI